LFLILATRIIKIIRMENNNPQPAAKVSDLEMATRQADFNIRAKEFATAYVKLSENWKINLRAIITPTGPIVQYVDTKDYDAKPAGLIGPGSANVETNEASKKVRKGKK
jgi:hypothetical protein